MDNTINTRKNWRDKLHRVIFEADTPSGKMFDVVLLIAILLSVIAVMLDSVDHIHRQYGEVLLAFEWVFTLLFTVEYVFRIITSFKPRRYILSFYGIIDLLAILPTYISLIVAGTQYLLVIRILRILRVFRILKLTRFTSASNYLMVALKESSHKITVFLEVVLTLVVIMGALMYLIEGPDHGFTSIPKSIYWAIVTLTTVGYGDIAPQTFAGQTLASVIMILGYSIIAVPTGIITVEMSQMKQKDKNTIRCSNCHTMGHINNAVYCHHCGEKLPKN